MFNVINLETGEPVEDISNTGRDAAMKARKLTEETGVKHQPRKIIEDTKWQDRERGRLLDGTYKPLPLDSDCIAMFDRTHPTHFLHMSDQPPMIAFTKDAQMGAADRQTRMVVDAYLDRYFPNLKATRKEIISKIESTSAPPIKFATTSEEIVHVYRNYARENEQVAYSCMRHSFSNLQCHPVFVYGAGDLAIAYFTNSENKTTHRTLCWPEKKVYSRMYAPDDKLHVALKSLGYCKSTYYQGGKGSFKGAKLLKIEVDYQEDIYIMPYIDECLGVKTNNDHFILTDCRQEEHGTNETNGITEEIEDDSPVCERCEEHCDETHQVYTRQIGARARNEQYWCEYCRDNHSLYCYGTGKNYPIDDVNFVTMQNGDTWSQGYFDENGETCDHTNENAPSEDLKLVTLLDGSIEYWSHNARREDAILEDGEWRERPIPSPDQPQLDIESTLPCP